MGRKVTAFSDLSGAEVPEDKLGRLVIRSHPDISAPVYLEALPEETAALARVNVPMVTVEWQPPGEGEAQTISMTVADFDKLAKPGPTSKLLDGAPRASGGRRSSGGEETNYASLEHAGRPHRGKISEEEAKFVREHLAEVNERLRAEGKRLIDPSNKEHKEQYGL